jgi:hypothetical protein
MTSYVYCTDTKLVNTEDLEKLTQSTPPYNFINDTFYEQSDKYSVAFDEKGIVNKIRYLLYTSDDVEKLRYTKPPQDFIVNKFYKQPDGYFFISFDENGLVRKIIRMYDDVDESNVGYRIMVYNAWRDCKSYTDVIPFDIVKSSGNYEHSFHTTYSCNFLNGKKCGIEHFPCRSIHWNEDLKHLYECIYVNNSSESLNYEWKNGDLVSGKRLIYRLRMGQNGLYYASVPAGSVSYIKRVDAYVNYYSSVYDSLLSNSIEYVK